MKRFLFLSLIIALTGCGVERAGRIDVGFTDYRPYAEEGIMISPDPYSGDDFTAIGDLCVVVVPGSVYENKEGLLKGGGHFIRETIGPSDVLKIMVDEAKKRGANGLFDYRIISNRDSAGNNISYEASAFLIKIHEDDGKKHN